MIVEEPLFAEITFHHLMLLIPAALTLIVIALSMYSIIQHAMVYEKPWEQKQ